MPENQNAIAALLPELIAIRRDIHRHPETGFEEHRTAAIVAERLESWGIEVTRGLAGTGVGNEDGFQRDRGALGAGDDALDFLHGRHHIGQGVSVKGLGVSLIPRRSLQFRPLGFTSTLLWGFARRAGSVRRDTIRALRAGDRLNQR